MHKIDRSTSRCSHAEQVLEGLEQEPEERRPRHLVGEPRADARQERGGPFLAEDLARLVFAVTIVRVLTTSIGCVSTVAIAPAAAPRTAPRSERLVPPRSRASYATRAKTKGTSRANCAASAPGGKKPRRPAACIARSAPSGVAYTRACSRCFITSPGTRTPLATKLPERGRDGDEQQPRHRGRALEQRALRRAVHRKIHGHRGNGEGQREGQPAVQRERTALAHQRVPFLAEGRACCSPAAAV